MFAAKKLLLVTGLATLLGAGAVQAQTGQQGTMGQMPCGMMPWMTGQGTGPGMMGPGMMGGGMMGPGMMGPGMMGQGMMGPGMMGQGMMGQGIGPGMMGQGGMPWCPGCGMTGGMMMGQPSNLNLSVADVKTNLERWLSWQGNPRLKVGDVAEKDGGTITADIVTTDNSLVQRLSVDRNSGAVRPVR